MKKDTRLRGSVWAGLALILVLSLAGCQGISPPPGPAPLPPANTPAGQASPVAAALPTPGTAATAPATPAGLAVPATEAAASPQPAPPLATAEGASGGAAAQLAIQAEPYGARVVVDGQLRGTSPVTVTLPAGVHQVAIDAPGFTPVTETLSLEAGQEGIFAPELAELLAEPATLAPARAAPPAPLHAPQQPEPEPVTYRIEKVIIPTYPYTRYLTTVSDPALAGYPVTVLDRQAYEAAQPAAAPAAYTKLILENRYLRIAILPELGGRIYEVVFKPTGHDEFYRNPVIKPTQWGPGTPEHPAGANWWLAAGGLEWCFPVEEHGYEWGNAWGYDYAMDSDGSGTVTVFTKDYRRPYVAVTIALAPDSAAFTIEPTIANPLAEPFRFKWWANAMLAPGPANKPGPDLRFLIPTDEMTVHSHSDPSLPPPGQPMAWPVYRGRDLSRLGNWTAWLGLFARPAAQAGFAAVYDTSADEGMVRVFPPDRVRGVKIFGLGWSRPVAPEDYTDGDSGYVELHGGLAPTFDDWNELPPGGQVTWTETWYPAAGVGGLVQATAAGAVNVTRAASGVRVAAFPARPLRGQVEITLPGQPPMRRPVQIAPDRPFTEEIAGEPGAGTVTVRLADESGRELVAYEGQLR